MASVDAIMCFRIRPYLGFGIGEICATVYDHIWDMASV
ncbi:hypothetical protein F383_22269 [Gossypium arboreum]|uniref:Uncharacterized protein n=1 Tax=Gossypium arboreum TaxID=29729 RepID=A0A0B0P432_GOSAR|nr:hypothetical protein F383_22269 [Gossypium arboreum]